MKESKVIWGLAAVVLFLMGAFLHLNNEYRGLKSDLNTANRKIQSMQLEHDSAIKAANAALKAREEEHARNQRKIAEAERVLEDNADFGALLLPDDIARLLCKDGTTCADENLPPAGGAAR